MIDMPEMSQKFIIFLIAGVLFLTLLVIILFTFSKSVPQMFSDLINKIKEVFSSFGR